MRWLVLLLWCVVSALMVFSIYQSFHMVREQRAVKHLLSVGL